jgi:TonB-linked SusC/RagA family outer membrane protein
MSAKNEHYYHLGKRIWILLLFFLPCQLFAQQATQVKGNVADGKDGTTLIGVSVKEKGTTNAVGTDKDGNYTIRVSRPNATLVFTSIGYVAKEVPLDGRSSLDVKLEAESRGLNEVVVVGYGTQKRGEVTSAIATVKSEDFTKGAVRDAAQLIQGKVAGLRITTPSGDPTASTQINLRGLNSISGTSEPLILIDGVPGSLNTVAPEDIESIDVLKDGSAAAIYGTRATGGVILITTRKNRADSKSTIEYTNYVNIQQIARKPEMLTATDYRKLISEGKQYIDYGGDTNWLDEILQNPVSQNHNLTLFGGNNTTNFTGSVNYRDWEGIFLRSGQKRLNVRASLNHSMFNDKLKTNIQVINRVTKAEQGGADGYAYRQAIIRNPTDNIYNEDGKWQEREAYNYDNPLGRINEATNDNTFKEMRLVGSLDYRPIKDLSLKLMASNVQNTNLYGTSTTFNHVNTTKAQLNGTASRSTYANNENLVEFTGNYTKSIGKHNFSLLGGYSWQDAVYETFSAYNYDFPTDAYTWNKLEAGSALQRGLATMSSYKSKWQLAGFFSRLTYNWDEKYLFMASIRREGSSKFGENYHWGSFPAASVGWRVSKEDFMKNVKFVSDLKLRAGYGVTGTIANDPYMSQTSYNFTYDQGAFINGKWVQGFVPARNFNPDLRWEKKKEYNVGVDFGLLSNRITGSLDYYTRKVEDLIYNFRVPVPPYLIESMLINAGTMENSGFEALVNFKAVDGKNFKWNSNVTYSTNKNKLVNLSNDNFDVTADFFDAGYTGEPIQTSTHRVRVGGPIGQFFVLKSVGVDANGKWLVENKDGQTISISDSSPDDRQYYGNGIPKFLLGWNNSFNYKNLDLSVNIRGAFGHDVLNMQRMYYENPVNKAYNAMKTAYEPKYGQQLNTDLVYVSEYIEKGDYVKIDNITLGYTFGDKVIKGIRNLRLYVSGLNLITITKYKGLDPEAVSYTGDFTFAPGIENRDAYPTTRTFTAGLNVSF